MTQRPTLIFDFDSTLVGFETLEALADVALDGAPDAEAVRSEIAALTDRAMAGEIPFGEALRRRLAHGNVYAADRVDAALANYFTASNLTALRELALLWVADEVDVALRRHRAEAASAPRTSRSSASATPHVTSAPAAGSSWRSASLPCVDSSRARWRSPSTCPTATSGSTPSTR